MIAGYYTSRIYPQGSHAVSHITLYRQLLLKDLPNVLSWRVECWVRTGDLAHARHRIYHWATTPPMKEERTCWLVCLCVSQFWFSQFVTNQTLLESMRSRVNGPCNPTANSRMRRTFIIMECFIVYFLNPRLLGLCTKVRSASGQ